MIIKQQKRDKRAPPRSKRLHVRDLTEYIVGMSEGGKEDDGKVLHRGALGFITDDFAGQQAEMIALAEEAVRSPMPVQHWIMSWQEGEQPSPAQADRAVAVFLKQLGLEGHQVIYALHDDTDNVHLHLAVNMVDPERLRVVFVRDNWDLGLQAAALLEHEQGWRAERGHRWTVNRDGVLERVGGRSAGPRPTARAERMETRTGEKSAQRVAAEEGAPAMLRAQSWLELHVNLAKAGMRFERKGSGAILWVGETAVKASQADRKCSIGALEQRLGPYEPAPAHVLEAVAPRAPEAASATSKEAGWRQYATERREHYGGRSEAYQELRQRFGREWMEMLARHRAARKETLAGAWAGRGAQLNEVRSRLAAHQAAEKAELKDRRQRARNLLRERFQRFPSYEEWLRRERGAELAEQWRYRERGAGASILSAEPGVGDAAAAPARDIRDFEARTSGWNVEYRRAPGAGGGHPVAFVDRGRQLDVFQHHDRSTVLAALQLAAEKWYGKMEVKGDVAYKNLCVELAAENGWTLTNPELQAAQSAARRRRDEIFAQARRRPPERQRQGQPVIISQGQVPPGTPAALNPGNPALAERAAPPTGLSVGLRTPAPASPAELYLRHFEAVRAQAPTVDVSRVDALVAVRLRVTGHDHGAIERILLDGPATARAGEARDWSVYARRAASYAFALPGRTDAQAFEAMRESLLVLEGRFEVSPAGRPAQLEHSGPEDEQQPRRPRDKERGGRGD